jgi:flagellar basal-body rod protein FlgB
MTSIKHLARLLLPFFGRQGLCVDIGRVQMSKTNSVIDLIEAGVRAESLRQKAIANNVANIETPGYRRIDVKFEELLAKFTDSSGAIDLGKAEPQIYQPNETPVKSNGNDVNLESEVGQMIKNTLRHKAYIRILNKKYRQIELAMEIK